jgi:hypothetical protein
MKKIMSLKIVLISFLFVSFTAGLKAQELGIRFGSTWGNYAAVDGVFGAGQFNRIHADLSFGGGGMALSGLWDFVYKPLGGEDFKWYAGVGLSTYFGSNNKYDNATSFRLGIPGEIGLEYRFKTAPLALGVDWRPVFQIVDNTSFNAGEFGLNFRYVFGK